MTNSEGITHKECAAKLLLLGYELKFKSGYGFYLVGDKSSYKYFQTYKAVLNWAIERNLKISTSDGNDERTKHRKIL